MSPSTQQQLAALAVAGDAQARYDLWLTIERYVHACLRRYPQCHRADLHSEAFIVYCNCVHLWDPQKGPLTKYFGFKLKSAVSEYMRKTALIVVPQHLVRAGVKLVVEEYVVEDQGDDISYT